MNKAVVIDSNVFAKIFHKEADSEQAEQFLGRCLEKGIKIIVPTLFLYEVIYIALKRNKNPRSVHKHLRLQSNIEFRELTPETIEQSLNIIEQTGNPKSGFPSFYDASYHALAIINNCDFITADRKHYEKTKELGNIRLLADIELPSE